MSETPEQKTKEQQALEAAEEYVVGAQCELHRTALIQGQFGQSNDWAYLEKLAREDEDFSKMEFSKEGYLVAGIHESRVIEHESSPDEAWHVGITCYSGSLVFDEEYWIVYKGDDGNWIVEGE